MRYLANLRARSAVEIIDATFHVYRAQFGVVVLIAAVITIPTAIAVAIVPAVVGGIVNLIGNLLLPIAEGAVALCTLAALSGEPIDAREAYRQMRGRKRNVVGVAVGCGILILLGTILLIVPGVIALIWTAVALPASVVEGLDFMQAFKRSRALARGHAGHVLGTILLAWVILLVLSMAGSFGTTLLATLFGAGDRASSLLFSCVEAVLFPVFGVVSTLLYLDLRVRTEGADIEAMAAGLPDAAKPSAPPPAHGMIGLTGGDVPSPACFT